MSTEHAFALKLAKKLRPLVPGKYHIETKRSLLYALSFDDDGVLQLGQNAEGEPTRGGGSGFEQDLLVFERTPRGNTSIVPRVAVELKFRQVTSHDAIVYSEKARRIRSIYPYVRYGLVLGAATFIPPRTLRLGTEFDFVVAIPKRMHRASLMRIAKLLRREIGLSRQLTSILRGRKKIALLHRDVRHEGSTARRSSTRSTARGK